jgi:glyoxylase-like metal-dependent hydrolase (beta-lactamase superfamily II)
MADESDEIADIEDARFCPSGGKATRLPDVAGYEAWLLRVGALEFEPGWVLPGRAARVDVNALLLRGHGETILIDAGSGPADVIWPGAPEHTLDEALAQAGIAKADVDAVVLTHLDFDHAGGALTGTWRDDLRPAFPRAILSEVDLGVLRPGEPENWDVATPIISLYRAAGTLELAADAAEFRPGLRLVSAPGHRPGHCVVLIGEELVHGADLIHHEEHLEHPEWDSTGDADPDVGLATRRAWFDRLAQSEVPVVFSHLPTRGRVRPGGRWEPAA